MSEYIIRRLALIIPTLLLVTIVVFLSVRFVPGDIVDLIVNRQQFSTPIDRAGLEHELGLDVPIYTQYGRWMWEILQGDLGKSLWTDRPVISDIALRFPVTLELGILGLIIAQIIALPIGVYSAIRQDTVGDYIARSFAIACVAIPSFWLGTIVMVFPSVWWGWTPPMEYVPFFENPLQNLAQFIIPAVILGMVISGVTMRMTRTMMLEVLRQDYIRTSWAKGLEEKNVVIRHALKNALIPVITIVGMQIPVLIGGSVIMEQIFVLPGVGTLMLGALSERDYPIVSGINIFVASFVLLINLVVDLSYAYMDPRVHYQ